MLAGAGRTVQALAATTPLGRTLAMLCDVHRSEHIAMGCASAAIAD